MQQGSPTTSIINGSNKIMPQLATLQVQQSPITSTVSSTVSPSSASEASSSAVQLSSGNDSKATSSTSNSNVALDQTSLFTLPLDYTNNPSLDHQLQHLYQTQQHPLLQVEPISSSSSSTNAGEIKNNLMILVRLSNALGSLQSALGEFKSSFNSKINSIEQHQRITEARIDAIEQQYRILQEQIMSLSSSLGMAASPESPLQPVVHLQPSISPSSGSNFKVSATPRIHSPMQSSSVPQIASQLQPKQFHCKEHNCTFASSSNYNRHLREVHNREPRYNNSRSNNSSAKNNSKVVKSTKGMKQQLKKSKRQRQELQQTTAIQHSPPIENSMLSNHQQYASQSTTSSSTTLESHAQCVHVEEKQDHQVKSSPTSSNISSGLVPSLNIVSSLQLPNHHQHGKAANHTSSDNYVLVSTTEESKEPHDMSNEEQWTVAMEDLILDL